MVRKISKTGIELIKTFEGCRLTAYKPVNTEFYWTIGYGHYGYDVYQGMTITQEQAEWMLISDLSDYEWYVNNSYYCPVTDKLNQNQFDALVSFCYNCGAGNLRFLCVGRSIEQIAETLPLYNKAGGNVLAGLVRRRKAEVELFQRKDLLSVDDNYIDFILDVLGDYWQRMDGNKEVQDYTHVVANELRKAVGRKEE